MNEVTSLFSIPFYQFKIKNWHEKKQKLKNLMHSENVDLVSNVKTSWKPNQSGNILEIKKILKDELNKFKLTSKSKFDITQVWFQEYENGMDHSAHIHGVLGYSSIIFIDFCEEHDSPVFISPYICSIRGNHIMVSPKVNEGDIVFFPSNILHFAPPNKSNSKRIICSFNMNGIDTSENLRKYS